MGMDLCRSKQPSILWQGMRFDRGSDAPSCLLRLRNGSSDLIRRFAALQRLTIKGLDDGADAVPLTGGAGLNDARYGLRVNVLNAPVKGVCQADHGAVLIE